MIDGIYVVIDALVKPLHQAEKYAAMIWAFFANNYTVLNNREWSLVIWFVLFIIYVFIKSDNRKIKLSLKVFVKTLFNHKIFSIFSLLVFYISGSVYVLYLLDFWSVQNLKTTIIWGFSAGLLSLFKKATLDVKQKFFKSWVLNNLTIAAIVQFIVNVYSFSFITEIILIPILVVIGVMLALSNDQIKYKKVYLFLNKIIIIFGIVIFYFSIKKIYEMFDKFANMVTLIDFSLPVILSIMFIPFIFVLRMYATYENIFSRISNRIDKRIKLKTKIYLLSKFHFNYGQLDHWFSIFFNHKNHGYEDVKNAVALTLKQIKNKKNPPKIEREYGWSPYFAQNILKNENLLTGYYHPFADDGWFAISNYINIDKAVFTNSLHYSISGNEDQVRELKLILDVWSEENKREMIDKYVSISSILMVNATGNELSSKLKLALKKCKNYSETIGIYIIQVERENWSDSKCFDLKFVINIKHGE